MLTLLHRLVVIIALLMLSLWIPTDESTHDLRILRLGVLMLTMVEGVLMLKAVFGVANVRDGVKGMALSAFFVFVVLILMETAFMFIPRSHGVGHTLGAQLWFKKYWSPINSMGYRDSEPVEGQKGAIFFVGDSFTAGHGLKHVDQRFSNVAGAHLEAAGQSVTVTNLGRNGMDTGQEFTDMVRFIDKTGMKPKAIVLQYFGNDIQGAASRSGLRFQGFPRYEGMRNGVIRLIRGSYLLNYLYWLMPRGDVSSYLEYMESAYQRPDIMELHQQELLEFNVFAAKNEIPLLVVLFPFMQDLELSEKIYMQRMREFLDAEGLPYIDVSPLITDLTPSERMVNINDGHASVLVNNRVGTAVSEHLAQVLSAPTHLPHQK